MVGFAPHLIVMQTIYPTKPTSAALSPGMISALRTGRGTYLSARGLLNRGLGTEATTDNDGSEWTIKLTPAGRSIGAALGAERLSDDEIRELARKRRELQRTERAKRAKRADDWDDDLDGPRRLCNVCGHELGPYGERHHQCGTAVQAAERAGYTRGVAAETTTTTTQLGEVTQFDEADGLGLVTLSSGLTRTFGLTSFRAGRPARHPAVGDQVDVVLSKQGSALIAVRLRK